MRRSDILRTGTAFLQQNRLRAGLSILGILIGIASVFSMMAISEGAKKLIADDIEKLGGANQFQFTTRAWITKNGRIIRWTRERFNIEDALAIERECPDVLCVLPQIGHRATFKTNHGNLMGATLTGVTSVYANWMRWEVQDGRFLCETDISSASQVCVLGSNVASRLFPETSPLGQEVRIRYYDDAAFVRHRVVGVMVPRGRNIQTGRSLDESVCVPLPTSQKRILGYRYVLKLTVNGTKKSQGIN